MCPSTGRLPGPTAVTRIWLPRGTAKRVELVTVADHARLLDVDFGPVTDREQAAAREWFARDHIAEARQVRERRAAAATGAADGTSS